MKRLIDQKPELDNIQTVRYGTMKTFLKYGTCASLLAMLMLPVTPAQASAFVQCPGDKNGDATWKAEDGETQPNNVRCMHLSSGDGYTNVPGRTEPLYAFGFGELTGVPIEDSHDRGILNAQFTAPTIDLKEGEKFYLSLSNVGMVERPDLFDAHTVHFHGFPNASSVFDGVPDASIAINMGATLTYFYNIVEPGTYLYHCHVEAAEHMQMGMQGNLYVEPKQNENYAGWIWQGNREEYLYRPNNTRWEHPFVNGVPDPDGSGRSYTKFAYNDIANGDPGSTGYDVAYPLMLTGMDSDFHDAHIAVQPLPFAEMEDDYHMFNGRAYPATVGDENYYVTAGTRGPAQDTIAERIKGMVNENATQNTVDPVTQEITYGYKQNFNTQPISSRMDATVGEKILLRITNLSITQFHTISVLGLPMKVVGQGGRELKDKYFANSVNLGGGESFDVIIDTKDAAPGTYYVYTNELHQLSNNTESFGGAMTEIHVAAAE